MSKVVSCLVITGALLASVPAFAGDGAVLINQASVMAAGGFPFKITQPGSYKLSGNLVVPAQTNGINISAVDVTLDLNGFTISGVIVCDTAGHNCGPSHTIAPAGVFSTAIGTTIRNGHVRGFSRGIHGLAGGNLVEEIHAISNDSSGIEARDAVVRRNNVSHNGGFGINCIDCLVTENIIALNSNSGLALGRGLFGSNVIHSNGQPNSLSQLVVSQHNSTCDGGTC